MQNDIVISAHHITRMITSHRLRRAACDLSDITRQHTFPDTITVKNTVIGRRDFVFRFTGRDLDERENELRSCTYSFFHPTLRMTYTLTVFND